MKGASGTRPKENLLHILENSAARGGGCASQTWAPHFELSFRVVESGGSQDAKGKTITNRLALLLTCRCTSYKPLVHRRRPSWGRSCRHSPWRACPPKSESPARRLVALQSG